MSIVNFKEFIFISSNGIKSRFILFFKLMCAQGSIFDPRRRRMLGKTRASVEVANAAAREWRQVWLIAGYAKWRDGEASS